MPKSRLRALASFAAIGAFALSGAGHAAGREAPAPPRTADVFVAPHGSDAAACSASAPCASLRRAYAVARPGAVVSIAAGTYPAQDVPPGTKAVTFLGAKGATLRKLDTHASNVTYDGLTIDAGFARSAGAAFEDHGADRVTFKNGSIGNVVDEKAALVSGSNFTFDNVLFHDAEMRTSGTHMECVYAIVVPGFTVRDSTFRDCAVMDLFFTYGTWWDPLPPAYGDVTIENNVFSHPEMEDNAGWHYYGLYVGMTADNRSALDGWVVRHNTFETSARIEATSSSGSRWVGNLGEWDCVPGVTYSHNVGTSCAAGDKAVAAASSSATRVAAVGWLDPAALDFRLLPGSPAIDAGDPADAPARDRDGTPRDGRPDAGAFEQ